VQVSNRRKVAGVSKARSSRTTALSTGKAGVRYRQEALEAFYDGFQGLQGSTFAGVSSPTVCLMASSN
jgi:hypothetical protein